jgi:hypothetical protein
MTTNKKTLPLRILEALAAFEDGRAAYVHLMWKVWPPKDYPRAYRHSGKGGPPGVSRVFSGALNRMRQQGLIARTRYSIGYEQRYGQPDVIILSTGRKALKDDLQA